MKEYVPQLLTKLKNYLNVVSIAHEETTVSTVL